DAGSVDACLVIYFRRDCSVAHQTTCLSVFSPFIDCWNGVTRSQRGDLGTLIVEEGIVGDNKCVNLQSRDCRECVVEFALSRSLKDVQLKAQRTRGGQYVFLLRLGD